MFRGEVVLPEEQRIMEEVLRTILFNVAGRKDHFAGKETVFSKTQARVCPLLLHNAKRSPKVKGLRMVRILNLIDRCSHIQK